MLRLRHLLYLLSVRTKHLTRFVFALVFVFAFLTSAVYTYTRVATPAPAYAATSSTLNYQGRLLTKTGENVPDGFYHMEFKLYDADSGGTAEWTETRTGAQENRVRVVNGYFSIALGEVTPFGAGIEWDQDHWVTLNVGGMDVNADWDGEMSPRMKLTSVPYAFQAKRAEILNKAAGGFTGILDFLSLTEDRNIYLPDADGTVVLDTTGFLNGGNSFGGLATIGTNDEEALSIITNGEERVNIGSDGLMSILNGLSVSGGLTLENGDLDISSGGLSIDGTTVITSGGVVQNVTASTDILTSGILGTQRGGTGVDGSSAANGQLLIGNGSGFTLGAITNSGGITITNDAGSIGIGVNYGSTANTAVEGDTTLTCPAGTGNLTGGGDVITLGSGGSCSNISTNNAVSFTTSVTTPVIANSGALTLQANATAGADDIVFTTAGTEKLRLLENGQLVFGTGANSANLYLSANDTLETEDSLTVGADLTVNGTTTVASLNASGLVSGTSGLTFTGTASINASGSAATSIGTGTGSITIGGGSNSFSINSSAFDVSSTGALSGISTLSASGAITAATATNTINGLVINSGSLSAITGFTQTSGNFAMSGTGSFSTGTGGVALNSATTISNSGAGAPGLTITQTGNNGNLALTNNAATASPLINLTHSASAYTGTAFRINMASGSGTFGSGNFLDFQLNGTSRFSVDSTGALRIATNSADALRVNNTSGLSLLDVDGTANVVAVGSSTADATTILFVLDSKNSAGDPTGQNGSLYYNAAENKMRCREAGVWTDCITDAVIGETTLGSASGTISVTLNRTVEEFTCRVSVKSRSGSAVPYIRFNNVSTGNLYSYNIYGITGTAVVDGQNISQNQINMATAGSTVPFSATIDVTNFSDIRKAVDWSAVGADAVTTQPNRFSGVGVYNLTNNTISSVQIVASTGTFAAGSHMYCTGRNVR